jgi:enolase
MLAADLFLVDSVVAREILDSRGNPTVEVDLTTKGGIFARAAVPSGASTGIYEACELRDGDKSRYVGKGVLQAVASVNNVLAKDLQGFDVRDQKGLDAKMCSLDGTANKSKLGANAILGVSMAAAKAAADGKGMPLYKHIAELAGNAGPMVLPVPCFNVVNGGSHAGNKLAFQEYFIIPVGAATFKEAIQIGAECYHTLKGIIKKKFGGDATLIGDEGGFAPPCDARGGVELVAEAIEKAGYKDKCKIGMDVAASEFKVEGQDCYDLGTWYPEAEKNDPALKMTGAKFTEFYEGLCKDFPIITIEDPFDQDDWAAWKSITEKIGVPTQVVGDDLTVTNVTRVQRAIDEKSCNALLLKVNQIGSLTEAIDAVKLCKVNGWGVMCSHRSGETEDTTIADIAVGLCCGQIKTGAPCRSDRNAKYNQLLRIEEQLGKDAVYAGARWRKPAWMGSTDSMVQSMTTKGPDLQAIFKRYDTAKVGCFQKPELIGLMESLKSGMTTAEVTELVEACAPGSSMISYNEFLSYVTGNSIIDKLIAREILDSRGNPTVEVDLYTRGGIFARAAVPSGASTGIHEACELRDGDKKRLLGKGVLKAVGSVNNVLAAALKGMDTKDQKALDDKMRELDGTPNKSKLGANAILGVSLAAAKAAALSKGCSLTKHIGDLAGNPNPVVLPVPCFNVINGGSHAGNKLAFQEYFIIPVGASSFKDACRIGCECYHELKKILKKRFGGDATLVGDEGGFAPPCDAKAGVELVWEAINASGYKDKCAIGMDVAASEFKVEGQDCYDLGTWYPPGEKDDPALKLTGVQLAEFYAGLCRDYPIITIEDPFDQDDWAAWTRFTEMVGGPTQVVGDDLTVTNVKRVQDAIDKKACNALLLKVNQIGTLTESIDAVKMCKKSGWGVMCSHRSGETEDTTIADIAVGLCTGQIKTGAPCRSDRNAKYNQLMRIEEELGDKAVYAGSTWRKPAWMS